MIKFEIVKEYEDKNINKPKRSTLGSAGYDIEAAEDIIVPSLFYVIRHIHGTTQVARSISSVVNYYLSSNEVEPKYIEDIKQIVKGNKLRTMVPTGLKAKMPKNVVLKLYPRSSTGANCLLQLANQTGIIDSDYYNNESNEGHIFIPLINLSPYDIIIKKGDKIAQGIFSEYMLVHDDDTTIQDECSQLRKGGFGSTDKNNK